MQHNHVSLTPDAWRLALDEEYICRFMPEGITNELV
jgi:hypothetical protein